MDRVKRVQWGRVVLKDFQVNPLDPARDEKLDKLDFKRVPLKQYLHFDPKTIQARINKEYVKVDIDPGHVADLLPKGDFDFNRAILVPHLQAGLAWNREGRDSDGDVIESYGSRVNGGQGVWIHGPKEDIGILKARDPDSHSIMTFLVPQGFFSIPKGDIRKNFEIKQVQ